MVCNPRWQLFDGSRPDYTNRYVFNAPCDRVTSVTASGLEGDDQITLLVEGPDGEYIPYLDEAGNPMVLTADQPTLIVDACANYRLDTSEIDDPTNVTVTTDTVFNHIRTSVTAHLTHMCCGPSIPIEIVRYQNSDVPAYFYLGTEDRIRQPRGILTVERIEGAWPCSVEFEYDEPTLTLTLLDGVGNPIPNTDIIVHIAVGEEPETTVEATTNLEGQFSGEIVASPDGDTVITVDVAPGCSTIGEYVIPQSGEEPTVPGIPNTAWVNNTQDSVTLIFTEPDDGGSPITSYTLQWRVSPDGEIQTVSPATSPYNLTDLEPGTEYEFRVYATNAIGDGEPSEWHPFETLPATPVNLTPPTIVEE